MPSSVSPSVSLYHCKIHGAHSKDPGPLNKYKAKPSHSCISLGQALGIYKNSKALLCIHFGDQDLSNKINISMATATPGIEGSEVYPISPSYLRDIPLYFVGYPLLFVANTHVVSVSGDCSCPPWGQVSPALS